MGLVYSSQSHFKVHTKPLQSSYNQRPFFLFVCVLFLLVLVLLQLKDMLLSGKKKTCFSCRTRSNCAFLRQKQIIKNQINTTKAFYLKNHSGRKVIILFLRSVIMIYKSIMKDVKAEFHQRGSDDFPQSQ